MMMMMRLKYGKIRRFHVLIVVAVLNIISVSFFRRFFFSLTYTDANHIKKTNHPCRFRNHQQ